MLSMEITNCFKLALSPEAKLGTGCPSLNEFLRGGLLPKRLYEIYGEAGTGKTNFAIQLLLNSVLPEVQTGLNGGALYVTAGRQLNEKRFNEMKDNFLAESAKVAQFQQQNAPVTENDVRTRIHIHHINSIDEYHKLFINLAARIDEQ